MNRVKAVLDKLLSRMTQLSPSRVALFIIALSLSVKLSYIFLLGGGLNIFPAEGTDGEVFDTAARVLLASGTFGMAPHQPTIGFPPGETFFLALLYALGGYSMAFAKLGHVALLTLVAVLTYLTGKRIAPPGIGFWAGVLIAIDPAQAYLSGTFLSESLYIFLMVLGIYIMVRQPAQIQLIDLIATGVCFGLGGLVRNEGWLFAFALFGGAILTRGKLLPVRSAAIALIVCLGVIAPWTFRNYKVADKFVLVSSNGGLTLWSANNPEFIWRQPMPMSLPVYDAPPGLSDTQLDQYYRQRAIDWITEHPADFVMNGFRKLIVLFSFDPLSARPQVAALYRIAGLFPYGVLLPFILAGLLLNLRNPKFAIILWYILFTMLITVVFWGDSRIRAPIQPYLYLFGVLGLQVFWRWLQTLGWRTANASLDQGDHK